MLSWKYGVGYRFIYIKVKRWHSLHYLWHVFHSAIKIKGEKEKPKKQTYHFFHYAAFLINRVLYIGKKKKKTFYNLLIQKCVNVISNLAEKWNVLLNLETK